MASQTRFLNPRTISKPPGYTHVVEVTGPGQLGMDVGGKIVGQAGDFRTQAIQVFENLKAALAEVGATFKDVVKMNNYVVDLKRHLPALREVRDMYMRGPNPPASTTIEIPALARDGALLETEMVAILPVKPAKSASSAASAKAKKKQSISSRKPTGKKRNRK